MFSYSTGEMVLIGWLVFLMEGNLDTCLVKGGVLNCRPVEVFGQTKPRVSNFKVLKTNQAKFWHSCGLVLGPE